MEEALTRAEKDAQERQEILNLIRDTNSGGVDATKNAFWERRRRSNSDLPVTPPERVPSARPVSVEIETIEINRVIRMAQQNRVPERKRASSFSAEGPLLQPSAGHGARNTSQPMTRQPAPNAMSLRSSGESGRAHQSALSILYGNEHGSTTAAVLPRTRLKRPISTPEIPAMPPGFNGSAVEFLGAQAVAYLLTSPRTTMPIVIGAPVSVVGEPVVGQPIS